MPQHWRSLSVANTAMDRFFRVGRSSQQLCTSGALAQIAAQTSSTLPALVAILFAAIWCSVAKPLVPAVIYQIPELQSNMSVKKRLHRPTCTNFNMLSP